MADVELYVKASETGKLKFWTMVAYETTKLRAEQGLFDDDICKAAYEQLKILREGSTGIFWGMISIRPRETATFEELEAVVLRIVKKKWLNNNCFWVFEQKGACNDTRGRGVHTHIFFKLVGLKHGSKQKNKSQCLNEILDTVHRSKLDVADNCVDITVGSKKDLGKAVNYLLGSKSSDEKKEVQKHDVIWRESLGLEPHYGNVELFTEEI